MIMSSSLPVLQSFGNAPYAKDGGGFNPRLMRLCVSVNTGSLNGNTINARKHVITRAREHDRDGMSEPAGFSFPFSNKLLLQVALGVFALGFIDAGYSGDWSRIGVISKETEEVLQSAAYFIVPVSLGLILYLSHKRT
eukprot:Gb_31849 [translate_table: standard]